MTRTDAHTFARPCDRRQRGTACIGLIAILTLALGMPAMAQQMPLTGHMLGNRPHTTQRPLHPPATHSAPATRVSDTHPDTPAPAVTYPAAPTQAAQRAQVPTTSTPPPPMPDYTDLRAPLDTPAPTLATPPPTSFGSPIGDTTAQLLRMQADNRRAGPALPMLGDEASAAYQRYLQSFHHPIPAFFKTNVETRGGGSGATTP